MLHTNFKAISLAVLEKKIFLRFLPYMGMAAILVMWPGRNKTFFPPLSRGCIWNLIEIGPVVSEEKSFENVDGRRTDDGRRRLPSYKLPRSLRLRGAKNFMQLLKVKIFKNSKIISSKKYYITPQGYKKLCSTQIGMKFFLLINVKMPIIVGIGKLVF